MPPQLFNSWLLRLKVQWKLLAKAGVWITILLGSFLLPPPVWDFRGGEDKTWYRFALFIAAALTGLVYVPARFSTHKRFAWRWWVVAVTCLIIGTGTFLYYQYLRSQWTCSYAGTKIIIGDRLTKDAEEYIRDKPYMTNELLVMQSAGATETIWERATLIQRRIILAGLYLISNALFAICILAIVQAIDCISRSSSGTRRRRGL